MGGISHETHEFVQNISGRFWNFATESVWPMMKLNKNSKQLEEYFVSKYSMVLEVLSLNVWFIINQKA